MLPRLLVCRFVAFGLTVQSVFISGEVFPLTRRPDDRGPQHARGVCAWWGGGDPMTRLRSARPTEMSQHHSKYQKNKGGYMLQLTSSSFPAQGDIPSQFTC